MSTGRWHAPVVPAPIDLPSARLVAVSSATRGSGKSVVAANLAASFAALGRQVVLVDLDDDRRRQGQLVGLRADSFAAATRSREDRDAAPVTTPIRNLRILTSPPQCIVGRLQDLDCDVIVVDVGPSTGATVPDELSEPFASTAQRLLVTPPDLDSLQATYFELRALVRSVRERRRSTGAASRSPQIKRALVGNRTCTPEEIETLHAFSRLVYAELGVSAPLVVSLQTSERLEESARTGQPLVTHRTIDSNVRAFQHLAERLVTEMTRDPVEDEVGDPAAGTDGVEAGGLLLVAALARHLRKHARIPVDWTGTLQLAAEAVAVRVRDVSATGAALETLLPLRLGELGVLRFDQLPGRPALPVTVCNVLAAERRVGVRFVVGHSGRLAPTSRIAASIARLARARFR